MSVQTMAWVLDHSETQFASRLILLSIASHAAADGTNAYPTKETIATEANVSRACVTKCLKDLERLGHIDVDHGGGTLSTEAQERRRGEGRGRRNCYTVVMDHNEIRARALQRGTGNTGQDLARTEPGGYGLGSSPHTGQNDAQYGPECASLFLIEPSLQPSLSPSADLSPDPLPFAAFWEQYPKDRHGAKVNKGKSQAIWLKLSAGDRKAAMVGVEIYADVCNNRGRYAKAANVWLGGRDWVDWQEPPDAQPDVGSRRVHAGIVQGINESWEEDE